MKNSNLACVNEYDFRISVVQNNEWRNRRNRRTLYTRTNDRQLEKGPAIMARVQSWSEVNRRAATSLNKEERDEREVSHSWCTDDDEDDIISAGRV